MLVTGGTGALGALMGHWALQHRASHTVLLGRTGRFAGSARLLASSRDCITARSCDIVARADAASLLDEPRRGIAAALHASEPPTYETHVQNT